MWMKVIYIWIIKDRLVVRGVILWIKEGVGIFVLLIKLKGF